ncbi:MAG: M14 family metallopeptidase, partial [Burkholderiales bacterium]|nr:M14 family metallopeptidase [Burkholderiales bacterium]
QAEYTGIAMEYGTLPMLDVMRAMRAEHWLNIHRDAPPELARQIKQQMMEAFYTDTDVWKERIISQARQAMLQAVDGLSS